MTETTETTSITDTVTAGAAGTWRLGDRTVNRMGFGAMRLLMREDPGQRDRAVEVLRLAVELGVNHIDTAAFYFTPGGSSNEMIKRALHPYSGDLVITTKVGPARSPDGAILPQARPDELRGQVEQNLRELGREHMDVVNLRIGATLERGTGPVADHVGALAELRDAGLIRHIGLSNIGPEHLREALAVAPIVCVQNQYSLTKRREDDALVADCAERGIAFVPFFAVGGSPSGATTEPDRRVVEVARRHGVSAAQVLLAWSLRQGPNVLAIPGTGDPAHLRENVAAGALRLTEAELAELDE